MFVVKGEREPMVNKTFRLPKSLLDELGRLAKENKISINNVVTQAVEYALDNMEKKK